MIVDLAISPCPNDTFIFNRFQEAGYFSKNIRLHMEDVEELNRRAIEEQRHQVTKLSFFAMFALENRGLYRMLASGGALGRGCGPLLLSNTKNSLQNLLETPSATILVPGKWTTAHLLLRLFLHHHGVSPETYQIKAVRYDQILSLLHSGEEKFGVIIHEERFTYPAYGLTALADLGDFWEKKSGLPIPLGCIAARSDLSDTLCREMEEKIRASIQYARTHPTDVMEFIKKHAQSLEETVIHSHIQLYVNDFSIDYGDEGRKAIAALKQQAFSSLPI